MIFKAFKIKRLDINNATNLFYLLHVKLAAYMNIRIIMISYNYFTSNFISSIFLPTIILFSKNKLNNNNMNG